MTGRLVWITEEEARQSIWLAVRYVGAPPDPVSAFIEATRDRPVYGDAEATTQTVAIGLRALGRP